MKRLMPALPALLLVAQAALADTPPPPPPHGGPPVEQMARELNLDATQKVEMKRIFEEQHAKHEAEREKFRAAGTRPTQDEMRARMQQDEQVLLQELKGVLDTEQLAKFKQLQDERRQHLREGGPGGPGMGGNPPPPSGNTPAD
jgi:Spy/CpxP family protein refolding chaperone